MAEHEHCTMESISIPIHFTQPSCSLIPKFLFLFMCGSHCSYDPQFSYPNVCVSPPVPSLERVVKWCEEMQGEIKELQRRIPAANAPAPLPLTPSSPLTPHSINETACMQNRQYLAGLDTVQVDSSCRITCIVAISLHM